MHIRTNSEMRSMYSHKILPDTLYEVYAHIKPESEDYELVLIDIPLGARNIESTDTILYIHPSIQVSASCKKYGWLRVKVSSDYSFNAEAQIVTFTSNDEAVLLLNKNSFI